MAINNSDLFVVQNSTDKQLYKLTLNELNLQLDSNPATSFKGLIDLSATPASQGADSPANGDLYIVQDDATINGAWTIDGSPGTADKNDQIIWSDENSTWYLLTDTNVGGGGQVVSVQGQVPIIVDATDPTNPIVKVNDALTATQLAADSTRSDAKGVVDGLAEAADVAEGNNSPDSSLVVTADLLNASNKRIAVLEANGGGSGSGTMLSLAEGTDTVNNVTNAFTIINNAEDYTIQVKKEVFCPYDFDSLDDISSAP